MASNGARLARGYERQLSGLGLSFHTVTLVETGETFNITCAIDYVVLAKNTYVGQRLRLRDACANSLAPVDAEFDSGGMATGSADPILYRGGPCGRNLLFRSQADLGSWLDGQPMSGKAAPLSEWLANWGRR